MAFLVLYGSYGVSIKCKAALILFLKEDCIDIYHDIKLLCSVDGRVQHLPSEFVKLLF